MKGSSDYIFSRSVFYKDSKSKNGPSLKLYDIPSCRHSCTRNLFTSNFNLLNVKVAII